VNGHPKVKKVVWVIFLLSFGFSLLRGGFNSLIQSVVPGLFMAGLIILLAILWRSIE